MTGYTIETNADLRRLADWMQTRPATARITLRVKHTGPLSTTTTVDPDGGTRTVVRIRDTKRGRRQWMTITNPDRGLEIKVGNRFVPWREAVMEDQHNDKEKKT